LDADETQIDPTLEELRLAFHEHAERLRKLAGQKTLATESGSMTTKEETLAPGRARNAERNLECPGLMSDMGFVAGHPVD